VVRGLSDERHVGLVCRDRDARAPRSSRSGVVAEDHLGDARRLRGALALEGHFDRHLYATRHWFDVHQLRTCTQPGTDGHRGHEADAICAVVDSHLHAVHSPDLRQEGRSKRQRQISVRDGPAEWATLGLLHVEVDPLMIPRRVSKELDSLLGDVEVVAVSEVFADVCGQCVDAGNDGGHGLSLPERPGSRRTASVEPDALMFLALRVQEQGDERDVEGKADDSGSEQAISQRGADVGIDHEVDDERTDCGGNAQPIAEALVVGHEQSTGGIEADDRQADQDSTWITKSQVVHLATTIEEVDETEESVEVEQPRRNLQRLWLHSVEPLLEVDLRHATSVAELASRCAFRLRLPCRSPERRQVDPVERPRRTQGEHRVRQAPDDPHSGARHRHDRRRSTRVRRHTRIAQGGVSARRESQCNGA